MLKKSTVILMVVLMVLGLFAGCQAPAAPEATEPVTTEEAMVTEPEAPAAEPITIDFMNFSANEGGLLTLGLMKDLFEKDNPNIKINIETFGWDTYGTQLQTRIGGGDAPDCFELGLDAFPSYVDQSAILPLDEMTAATTTDLSMLTEKSVQAFSLNGVKYGMPYSYSTVVLIYNKDLFDQAGVSYPTADWTWADADAAALKIKALGEDYYGLIQPISTYEFFKVVKQYNGGLLNDDNTAFTVNRAENVEALQRLVDNVQVTNICPSTEQRGSLDEWGMFKLGKTGMIVTGIWAFPSFTTDCAFNWDIAVEPGAVTKATHYFANGLAISADSENAEAAYKWIEFLATSEQVAQLRIQLGWELPCATYQTAMDQYAKLTPPANRQAVFDSLDYVVPVPQIAQFSQMGDILGAELEAAANGTKTPQQALDDAQAALEAAITLG
ncbi:MAG: sugar ABC transporter substrate-binding protein [Firmicutes bacterium HGW-Firmicutes-9]|nr:MAG: sugar ABC transporter substrate-binding protein [Firmicutes bacterium HGW-Firmicutes-9]